MHKAIRIAIAAAAASGSAMAADLPVKAPVYAPPVLYNWSGLYLGANIGGAWSNRTLNIAGTAWDDPGSTAFIGGFQLGYNLQAGHFLLGVEGEFDWASFGRPARQPPQTSDRAVPCRSPGWHRSLMAPL